MRGVPGADVGPAAEAPTGLAEAEDVLRAIAAGEVDAFVVSGGGGGERVFTLSTADRPYRMFVENMRDGAATLAPNGLILYANRRLAELLSCSSQTIVGSPLVRFLADGSAIALDELRGPGRRGATLELELLDADGAVLPVLVGSSPLDVDGDELTCLTFTDLSAQKAQEREIARLSQAQAARVADLQAAQVALTEQATHDGLTGLPNRGLLVDRVDQALSRSRRSGGCVAVLFVDLDRFKHVNDGDGHAAGDALLCRVADRLVAALRPMDTVARVGGDEFVVLAPEVGDRLHAVDISARLLAALGDAGVAASVGISISVGGRGTAEILLAEADTAMYQAKALGRGRAAVFDPTLRQEFEERTLALARLGSALADGRILVHYQPIVDLASGGCVGFEALARIAEPDGSVLAPWAFVPAAEDSGLIVPLGARVLGTACGEATRWRATGPGDHGLTVAVNLSPRQFEPGDLSETVRAGLDAAGLDPRCLHLELTETAVIDLDPDIVRQLGRIRDLGVEVGLDDFGTGYASLTHLRRLPLSFVKIDRSFVEGLGVDHEDAGIVSAVVDLAANLGLRSIAEGVETADQLARLRELGCDEAQGYLFGRPSPAGDLAGALDHPGW